jgi:hypothetical protein
MQKENSVAVGIRLYEESTCVEAHCRDGAVKTALLLSNAIVKIREDCPDARIYVFCTHRARMLSDLALPENTVFMTAQDGYSDPVDTLWLLAQCRHHIFMNSSFYWWGAWLSAGLRRSEPQTQRIIAADNFVNRDAVCAHWETF